MKKWLIACSTFLLLMILMPFSASAGKLTALWVENAASTANVIEPLSGEQPTDAIHCWYSSDLRAYCLFLPAYMDHTQLRLCFTGAKSITINDIPIASGDMVNFLVPESSHLIATDEKKYTLKVMQSENIPALFVNTASGNLDHLHKRKGRQEKAVLTMLNCDGSIEYNGDLTYIKTRGNSTFTHAKKPYQIKLAKSTDLCGMGKSKTWILLADYRDNSLLRNKITLELSKAVGLSYISESQHVDLYINNDYLGTYLLCEKVEVGKNRVDINNLDKANEAANEKPPESYPVYGKTAVGRGKGMALPENPADITGGYLVQLEYTDRYGENASGYKTTRGQAIIFRSPQYASRAQVNYIAAILQSFENAIFSKNGIDSKTGKHFTQLADIDSFASRYIIEELSKNNDANRSSQYFYKDSDSVSPLLFAGPSWDYDTAYGNYARTKNAPILDPGAFSVKSDQSETYFWYPALYKQPAFYEQVVKNYQEKYIPAVDILLGNTQPATTDSLRSIDAYADSIRASAEMNFTRWPVFNSPERLVKTGKNYQANIDYIKKFLTERHDFLQRKWK